MNKISKYLLFTTILLTFIVDLRLAGFSLKFFRGDFGMGYPRMIEISAICLIVSSLFINKRTTKFDIQIILFVFLMFVFTLFKDNYAHYYRTAILIPMLTIIAINRMNLDNYKIESYIDLIYYVISLSSLFVCLNPYINLGVEKYHIDSFDESLQRYVGFGQSLPYQALFSLIGICLYFYKESKSFNYYVNQIFFFINSLAIILIGARTGYIGYIIILLLNYKAVLKALKSIKLLLMLLIALIIFHDSINNAIVNTFLARNDFSDMAGRNEVWYISLMLILNSPIFGITDYYKEGSQFGKVIAHSQNAFFEMIFWGGFISLFLYSRIYIKIYKKITLNLSSSINLTRSILILYVIFSTTEIIFYSIQDHITINILFALLYKKAMNKNEIIFKDKQYESSF